MLVKVVLVFRALLIDILPVISCDNYYPMMLEMTFLLYACIICILVPFYSNKHQSRVIGVV